MDAEVRRPRVARETRLLLTVALLAVVALWALSRLRYPDTTSARQVVAPILAPLVARQGLAGLESQLVDASTRITPSLVSLSVESDDPGAPARHVAALHLHDEVAVALPGERRAVRSDDGTVVAARDITGLTVFRLPAGPAAPIAQAWFRRDPRLPRYALQTSVSEAGPSLVPVLVSGLVPVEAPLWSGSLWQATSSRDLTPGAFLFTPDGEWIGLVVAQPAGPAIAPADLVSRLAEAHLQRAGSGTASLGVDVQPMTDALRDLLGFPDGVVVTWVDGDGPARDSLRVGDVPHAADGRALPTIDHWRRHLADLGGAPTVLKVWRAGQSIDVPITPAARTAPPGAVVSAAAPLPLGLTTRLLPRVGSEVTAVDPGSRAHAADLRAGDVITRAGTIAAPTPAQIRALAAEPKAGAVLVAVTRDGRHLLTVLSP